MLKRLDDADIYLGDCISVMQGMESNIIDLTVTSPPYDNLRTYAGTLEWNFEIFKKVANELYRITKTGGVVVWVVGDATIKGSETLNSFKQAIYFNEIGFNVHDTMIYHKDNPPPVGGNNRYYQAFEYMFVLSKGSPKLNPIEVQRRNKWNDKRTVRTRGVTRNQDGDFTVKEVKIKEIVKKQNVWSYVVSGGASATDKIAYKHPAIFPEKLAQDHILSWSNPGDLVFDPFMGSATTGKMALLNSRKFIGIEKVPEYFNISEQRILQAQETILENILC